MQIALLGAVMLIGASTSFSQSGSNFEEKRAEDSTRQLAIPPEVARFSGQIQYVGPDTYLLLDEQGRPQPVPGMTYEDFLAAWKKSQQAAEADPQRRYSIDVIDMAGNVRDGHARLQLKAKVKLLISGPVDVPLGLVGAILDGEPIFQRVGDAGLPIKSWLYFNPERGGYIARFEGRTSDECEIALELLVPLSRSGTETTFPLNCPRSLASSITLDVPGTVSNAAVNSGMLLATQTTSTGGSRLKAVGAGGTVRLTWHSGETAAGEVASVLGAAGTIRISIDGRSVRSVARLSVQSYGGGFDRFHVRLPPGAQLRRDEAAAAGERKPNYQVSIEEDSADIGDQGYPGSQIVLVELPSKQQGRTVVELSVEQPIGLDKSGPVVELGGFEVIGAVRQYGDVAIEVADDWQVRWMLGDNIRQVDASELDTALQHAGVTTAFQYDRQPWSLGAQITPRQFRVHATPRYELDVSQDEARLTVHIAYQVFGTRAFEFGVGLNGWDRAETPIESGGLVDQDRIQVTPDDTLILPLAQSASRRVEISFALRRPLSRRERRMQLPLPIPLVDSLGASELVVSSAADVELIPDPVASSGLSPSAVTNATEEESPSQLATHRFRLSQPNAVFVAERRSRAREVAVSARAKVEVQASAATVEQRFDYIVRHDPIKELRFEIPTELSTELKEAEIVLLQPNSGATGGGESELPLSGTASDSDEPTATLRQLRVPLPQPRLGQFALRIRYQTKPPESALTTGSWPIPLLQEADGALTSLTAIAETPRSLAVALDPVAVNTSWKLAQPAVAEADFSRGQEFVASNAESRLPLIVRAVDPNLPSVTIVERVWLQTWLAREIRQDRAAIRFRTMAPQSTIELPPQVPPDEVEVLLDGQPAQLLSRGAGRILIRLSNASDEHHQPISASHTVELRYRQPVHAGILTRHRLTPPQIIGSSALSEVYWQIVLPGDQHIVRSPDRLASASTWQWLTGFWGRRPNLNQAELEQWSGASPQVAPADSASVYLFTSLAPLLTIEVVTAPRWLIVFLASSAVLAAALAWIYVPLFLRQPLVIGLAIAIAGLAIAFPTPALLLGQAAALGVLVILVSVIINRLFARPALYPVTLSSGSSLRQASPHRTDSVLITPVASASTAPTVPLAIPDIDR